MPRDVTWTQLASTVEAGDSEFTVIVDTDWRVGDEIVVTATSYEAWHTETFRISSKTDSRTFSINGTFAHMHTGWLHDFSIWDCMMPFMATSNPWSFSCSGQIPQSNPQTISIHNVNTQMSTLILCTFFTIETHKKMPNYILTIETLDKYAIEASIRSPIIYIHYPIFDQTLSL